MSQRDYSSLPGGEESPIITAMLGVAAVALVIGVIVVSYYLKAHYGVFLWSFGG